MDSATIVREIEGEENKRRKAISFQQMEIYGGRLDQYVKQYVRSRYGDGARTMPIISSINIAKRIVEKSSSLYTKSPKRHFRNCTDKVAEMLENVYAKMSVNQKMKMANKMYKAQEQHILQVIPKNGELTLRNFKMHNIDAIENPEDPENALAYITSSFDRDIYQRSQGGDLGMISSTNNYRDGNNSIIADRDDFKKRAKRYIYWSETENYIMDVDGQIVSEETDNKLGVLNFVDISMHKDNEFFVRTSGDLYDFTIQLNAALSSLWQIVDMQGFAIGYLIAHSDVMPQTLTVGPTRIVRLPITDETSNTRPEFGFVSPNADLAGSREFIDLLLSLFLTSRGNDGKMINTSGEAEKFTSGLDRFIAHVEKFQSSEDDIFVMERAEKQLFEIIKTIINNTSNTTLLGAEYSFSIPENAEIEIEYAKPEVLKTDNDVVDLWIKKIEADLGSIVDAIKDIYKIDNDQDAIDLIKKWDDQKLLLGKEGQIVSEDSGLES